MSADPHLARAGRPEDDRALDAMTDAVLDGSPSDWPEQTSGANLDDALARELRVLVELAVVHRRGPENRVRAFTRPETTRQWGHLQIRGQVGRGSFGDVFRAWDPRLSREVALKLLDVPTSDDPAKRDWVLHEARCLAAIRHPNVVTVYGADRIDGRTGIWTEFVSGRTLAEIVAANGPMAADDAAAIGADLGRALAAVHDAGLLHRDIKATNAMRDATGRVVLLDFGASKDCAPGAAPAARETGAHGPTGTPLYVAPEIWRGAPATPQSDIYSLGVLLYFLVTGAYPVRGASVRDVDLAHRAGRRVPIGEERRELPAPFVSIVERATDPDPARRFESAAALGDALARVADELRAPTPIARRVARRWRALAAIAAVLASAGVAAYVTWPRPQIAGWGNGFRIPDGQTGHASRDGRFLPYVDARGDVRVVEVATGRSRLIEPHDADQLGVTWRVRADGTRNNGIGWGLTVMSPDGDRVAYAWYLGAASDEYELRLANRDGTWARTLVERRSEFPPVPVDWAADGSSILCWFGRPGNQWDLALISTVDRSIRVLFTVTGGIPASSTISPDGRFVALEQVSQGTPRIATVDTTGRDPHAPANVLFPEGRSAMPAWIDATHLAFLRPNGDDPSLGDFWIADVVNGAVVGNPICVLKGSYEFSPATRFQLVGRTFIQVVRTAFLNEVYRVPIDLSRATSGTPSPIAPTEMFHHLAPSFSTDGRQLAYFTGRPEANQFWKDDPVLTIQDTASGRIRQPATRLNLGRRSPQWLADGRHVRVFGSEDPSANARGGWYRLDTETGEASDPVAMGQLCTFLPDGSGYIYLNIPAMGTPENLGIVRHLFGTSTERTLIPTPEHGGLKGQVALSRDGRHLAFVSFVTDAQHVVTQRLETLDLETGARLALVQAVSPQVLFVETFTSDNRFVLYSRGTAPPAQVWMIPATGGESRAFALRLPTAGNSLQINAAGTEVAYSEQISEQLLWTRPLPLTPIPPKHR